jgi:hypothetical protein
MEKYQNPNEREYYAQQRIVKPFSIRCYVFQLEYKLRELTDKISKPKKGVKVN